MINSAVLPSSASGNGSYGGGGAMLLKLRSWLWKYLEVSIAAKWFCKGRPKVNPTPVEILTDSLQ